MAIPIPNRPSGFVLGDKRAAVTIDVFVDIQCPHSKQAWSTVLGVLQHYSGASLGVTVHLITISNHRQAWDVSLGLIAYSGSDVDKFIGFATFLYEQQARFSNAEFLNKTHRELKSLIADFAYEYAQFDRETMLELLEDHEVYIAGRTPIRYAATRAVWATPTFLINNADDVPLDHRSTLRDWVSLLDSLMTPS